MADDKVLLRSFSGTVLVSGAFVSSKLEALLRSLDGSKTAIELLADVGGDFRGETEHFLELLVRKNLLSSGGDDNVSSYGEGLSSRDMAYWSLHEGSEEAASRLGSSTVVVTNLGGVGSAVARCLALAGVGKLVLLDAHTVRKSDQAFGYDAKSVGQPRADALAQDPAIARCKAVQAISSAPNGLSSLEQVVSGASLVIVCSDNMSLAGYDRINELCIRQRTRWISARIDRHLGIVGPFVVPEQTPCFACFELRSRANADHPADHQAIYQHWKHVDDCPDDWPTKSSFANIVAGYVALDAQRVLAGRRLSAVYGRLLQLDLHTFESRFHEILKLPRCPACSRLRDRPLTKIWDIRSGEPAKGAT